MGWILSKFRKSQSTMEILTKLEAEINNISQFKASTVVWQKKVVGHLVTYSIVIYLLLAIFAYFKLLPAVRDTKEQMFLILPFLIFPALIWGLRRLLTWWYHRKIIRDEKKLELLKQRKLKLLDEVMEKETYKVAKEILDKFGEKASIVGGVRPPLPGMSAVFKPGPGDRAGDSQLRRRPLTDHNKTMPVRPNQGPGAPTMTPTPGTMKHNSSLSVTGPRPGPGGLTPTVGPALAPPHRPGGGGGGRSVPGPPLPRPVLPRERGYLDKFVEFLVGDGPANRYALICRQCESHNGMALREEFEYIAFRCCYCYYWNPARKQRPVAPRLTPAAERPAQTLSDSSGSDISAPSSTTGSRRGSAAGTVSREERLELTQTEAEQTKAEDVITDLQTEEVAVQGNELANETETNEEESYKKEDAIEKEDIEEESSVVDQKEENVIEKDIQEESKIITKKEEENAEKYETETPSNVEENTMEVDS